MTDYQNMGLNEMSKLDGIKDLPIRVKGKFCQALKLEAEGKHTEAMDKLNEGIAIEEELSQEKGKK